MKSKFCAWIICVALGIAALTGCGASSTKETTEARKESGGFPVLDESAILGQINKMDGNTISIEIGTQPNVHEQNGERPSMIDLTGEEQEIYVTDSTTITRQSLGKQRDNKDNADQSEDENKPEEVDDNGRNNPSERQQPESEAITMEDISVGEIISVTLDENNNADSITVISGGNRGVKNEDN